MSLPPFSAAKDDAAAVQKRATWRNPLVWLETWCMILIEQVLRRFAANVLQRRFVQVVMACLKHKLPIRIICLKPRQRGISTISIGVMIWLCHIWRMRAAICGGIKEQSANLYKIAKTYLETDNFPWGLTWKITDDELECDNGSLVTQHSAEQGAPGRSSTFSAAVFTETGWWGDDSKVRSASKVLAAFMACIKPVFKTFVVMESTSSGPAGMFYEQWKEAVDMDAFLRDPEAYHGRFVRVFAGVFEFPDICDPVRDVKEASEIMDGVGARNEAERVRERQLARRYALSAGQIKAWRRLLLECANDPQKRDLEYPVTPDDAWKAGTLGRFNSEGLFQLRERLPSYTQAIQTGAIDQATGDTTRWRFVPGSPHASTSDFLVAEPPRPRCRYILIVDTMKGRASGEDKRNTDCHAVLVLRDEYFDASTSTYYAPKVVATIRPPNRSEAFQIGELARRLSLYYGGCPIVVEANNEPGVIPYLKDKGANLWMERKRAESDKEGDQTGKFGFWMSDNASSQGVRSQILSTLAQRIEQIATTEPRGGIEIPFEFIVAELEKFVRNPDTGKAAAMQGYHDDWVMALAIGSELLADGQAYTPPIETYTPTAHAQGLAHHPVNPFSLPSHQQQLGTPGTAV